MGLITKHAEKARAYRHAENPIQAFRDAIKEVRSRAIRDEAELEAVFKGEMIRRGKIVYQADIPSGPGREDESCAPGKKIEAQKGPGQKREANAEKASAGARKEEGAKIGRKVASFGRKHYGKRFWRYANKTSPTATGHLALQSHGQGWQNSRTTFGLPGARRATQRAWVSQRMWAAQCTRVAQQR